MFMVCMTKAKFTKNIQYHVAIKDLCETKKKNQEVVRSPLGGVNERKQKMDSRLDENLCNPYAVAVRPRAIVLSFMDGGTRATLILGATMAVRAAASLAVI